MNSGPASPLYPELARQRMNSTGSHVAILLVKLQRIKLAGRSQNTTIYFKSIFENRRDNMAYQDIEHQTDSMSRPPLDSTSMSQTPLDSTTLGTNTTN